MQNSNWLVFLVNKRMYIYTILIVSSFILQCLLVSFYFLSIKNRNTGYDARFDNLVITKGFDINFEYPIPSYFIDNGIISDSTTTSILLAGDSDNNKEYCYSLNAVVTNNSSKKADDSVVTKLIVKDDTDKVLLDTEVNSFDTKTVSVPNALNGNEYKFLVNEDDKGKIHYYTLVLSIDGNAYLPENFNLNANIEVAKVNCD